MLKISITPKELINLLSKKDKIIGQGTYGIVMPYDEDALIKIYYKKIFDGYYNLDEGKVIEEIDVCKKVDMQMNILFSDNKDAIKRKKAKMQMLYDIGLVKANVFCNDYELGILLKYYKEYEKIDSIFYCLPLNDKVAVLSKIEQYLSALMENNIYPRDIKESNILIRKRDLDVKLIDLDDEETRYEEKEYVDAYPHIKKECIDKYKVMSKRLMR